MTLTTERHAGEPGDDYIVETETERARPAVSQQFVRLLQAIFVIAITVLSFAVFWVAGLILGVF